MHPTKNRTTLVDLILKELALTALGEASFGSDNSHMEFVDNNPVAAQQDKLVEYTADYTELLKLLAELVEFDELLAASCEMLGTVGGQ